MVSPKETFITIMMIYKDTKILVCSPDGDTDFDIVIGDILAPYIFILCLGYVLRTAINQVRENFLPIFLNPTEPTTDTNYIDDLALLANTPCQVKSLLHSLQQTAAVGSIGLCVNANKTDFVFVFNWNHFEMRLLNLRINFLFIYFLSSSW